MTSDDEGRASAGEGTIARSPHRPACCLERPQRWHREGPRGLGGPRGETELGAGRRAEERARVRRARMSMCA